MIPGASEQRNVYKGCPPRPWVHLRLAVPDGTALEVELLADTGNPCAIITSQAVMARLKHRSAPNLNSNFGLLLGGWVHLAMPELGLDHDMEGYASGQVVAGTKASTPDIEGLAGLPFLRLLEYGGDSSWFWLRVGAGSP